MEIILSNFVNFVEKDDNTRGFTERLDNNPGPDAT